MYFCFSLWRKEGHRICWVVSGPGKSLGRTFAVIVLHLLEMPKKKQPHLLRKKEFPSKPPANLIKFVWVTLEKQRSQPHNPGGNPP